MRPLINATVLSLVGLSIALMSCGSSRSTHRRGTDSSGDGGAGGAACVAETCDGVDNNCDGQIDEGCSCIPGSMQACYSGPKGTEGVGLCKAGTRACDATTLQFGPCMGEVLPAAMDACDGADDDCNGAVDDGLPDLTCGVGACAATAPACVNGAPGDCVPGSPTEEICDGIDNNCDQLVDETFPESGQGCSTGLPGVCGVGEQQCQGGALTCVQNVFSSAEACDSLDNDCDGAVDDNVPGTGGACATGQPGVCSSGKIQCKSGSISCVPLVQPKAELCDNLDNNCDGLIDENNPGGGVACSTGQPGACAAGTLLCQGGALSCEPNTFAQFETCDGIDNDCNGLTDDGDPGAGLPCSCGGVATCSLGHIECIGCTKEVDCDNGVDDDADGFADCADAECSLGCDANVGPCAPGERLVVLTATDTPLGIPDNSFTSSVISVAEIATVQRVVVQTDITHTYDGDLIIALDSPDGIHVTLSGNHGSGGANYAGTIFNDACASPISFGTAPFSGCYAPDELLSSFMSGSANGPWTLTVSDTAQADTGTLNTWALALCVK